MYSSVKGIIDQTKGIIEISESGVNITDADKLRKETIDELIYNGVFNEDSHIQNTCYWIVWQCAQKLNAVPSSIHDLYKAMGEGKCGGFTVPAINVRGLTYDVSRTIFHAALKNNVGPFIFEIARSEMGYTYQRPIEYVSVILAAAIKEGYTGPVFIQGDHFQLSARKYKENKEAETNAIKELSKEAIEAGFYNIDIDSSTLVDLDKSNIPEQQYDNFTAAANITKYIREIEPKGVTVSVGGEIGEVGSKNSTPEELKGFMDGYTESLKKIDPNHEALSKISIQTGTSHGGVVLPDGSIAKVSIDFDTLRKLSQISKKDYGMAGAVQHGASTLPPDAFNKFPEAETAEVHLATEFQNMIYENSAFPADLKKEIYDYLHKEHGDEKKADQTEEQFIYKTRKRGFGPFKQKMWKLPSSVRGSINKALEEKFTFLFNKLNVVNTKDQVKKYIKLNKVDKPIPEGLKAALQGKEVAAVKAAGTKSAKEEGYHPDELGE